MGKNLWNACGSRALWNAL
ncbi:hypothetical protein RSAG8_13697, partial [Rhizoctonia solani AG-8 WAC10335]